MTKTQYRKILDQLYPSVSLHQQTARVAADLGISARQAQRYAYGEVEISERTAKHLKLMTEKT